MRQKLQLIYFVCGYAMPVAGVILTIIFTVMYGSQFGRRAVIISDGVGGTSRIDGPKEQYIAYFWAVSVMQMLFLISNVFGPCSAYTRLHFTWQIVGILVDFVYLVLSLQASSEWPHSASGSNPSWRFLLGSCMQLCGQVVLAWGAARISGVGLTAAAKRNPSNIASHVPFGSVFVRVTSDTGRRWGSDSGSDAGDDEGGGEAAELLEDEAAAAAVEDDKLRRLREIAEANSGMYRSPRVQLHVTSH